MTLVLLLLAGVAVAVALSSTSGDAASAPSADAVVAYQRAIHPALAEGGRIVEQGMKPAVADLRSPGGVPDSAIADEADAWVRTLSDVRSRVSAVAPPDGLAEAARLFQVALERYVAAASLFGRAARRPVAERGTLVEDGVAQARAADVAYDDASRILQRLRRDLGLGPTADFPDPATSPSAGP